MDSDLQTWLWLGGGLALLGSELVAPNLVVGFLGAGALTVAGLRAGGLVDGTWASVAVWAVSSGAYLLLLRRAFSRWFGKAESRRDSTSEELQSFGQVVEVIERVAAEEPGRIRWQGTTWKAHTLGPVLEAGAKARLLHRDNIGWVVEPEDALSAAPLAVVEPDPVVPARVREKV